MIMIMKIKRYQNLSSKIMPLMPVLLQPVPVKIEPKAAVQSIT